MNYGAAGRGVGAPVSNAHARSMGLLLSFAVLSMVAFSMNRGVQIDVSPASPASVKLQESLSVQLTTSAKARVDANDLGMLMHSLKKSSYCWFRDLGLSSQCRFPLGTVEPSSVSLASTGKDGTQDKHLCLATLLAEKKTASGLAGVGGGDIAGCDADTCDKCKQAPLSAAKAEEVALKKYMDSSAAVDVYKAKTPDIAGYSNEKLLKLLEQRALESKNEAQSVEVTGNDATDILAQCKNVEEYVAIVAAHDAEKHLKKFIAEKKIEEYEADNPSISDYTDGTCPGTAELENYSTIDCFGLDHCSTRCAAAECC